MFDLDYLWGIAMGWKKRLRLKIKPKPKPVPVPVPTPPPPPTGDIKVRLDGLEKRTLLLEQKERAIEDLLVRVVELERRLVLQEKEQLAIIDRLAQYGGKVSEAMATVDELKVKVQALEDVCNAAESAIERLSEAVEWLRKNQADLSGLKEVADKLDEMKAELEASVAASGASGGV